MTTMTSSEFTQHADTAQRQARHAPVVITDQGKPRLVLLDYEEYRRLKGPEKTLAQWFEQGNPEAADVDFPIEPRSTAQRPKVDLGD